MVQLPEKVATVRIKVRQKANSESQEGNELADREAKEAARGEITTEGDLIPDGNISVQGKPNYNREDQKFITDQDGTFNEEGWASRSQGRIIVPSSSLWPLVRSKHQKTRWGVDALYQYLISKIIARNLYATVQQVTHQCDLCFQTNSKNNLKSKIGKTGRGNRPGQQWQIALMELSRKKGYRYLLLLTDTFSGWSEAFLTGTSKDREVTKVSLQEIIPRFGVPATVSLDGGPHFVSTAIQQISEWFGIDCQLHTPCHPMSSGQVEKMNHLIIQQIVKLGQEASLPWFQALPLALSWVQTKPRTREGLSPFERLYGRPYGIQQGMSPQVWEEIMNTYIIELGKQLKRIEKHVAWTWSRGLDDTVHNIQPGDYVYIKSFKPIDEEDLEPRQKGPFQVLLMTFTAVKIKDQSAWIHRTQVKKAPKAPWKVTWR